jgi:REP element-mobilizing transposase RayT
MPATIYVHLTWTTYRQQPLIDASVAKFLRRFLPAAARRLGADVLEVGIVRDHLHALLLLQPVVDVPRLVQGLKGASARIANRDVIGTGRKLKWARGYDLRSVSVQAVDRVTTYIRTQERRHPLDRIRD